MCDKACSTAEIAYLNVDLCRAELLVEIEGIADCLGEPAGCSNADEPATLCSDGTSSN
jgi:hypothetical protein